MRKIEFRGKRVDTGAWVYGGYHKHIKRQISPIGDSLQDDDIAHLIIQSGFADWNMPKPLQAIEVIPETVGQFTGLHDKNGKEIYEGDVVKVSDMKVMIRWNNKTSSFHGLFMIGSRQMDTVNLGCLTSDDEIIGNIHDNPDLLKEVSHEA